MTGQVKHILLVEDSPNDVELILTSLAEGGLTNEVVVVRDGEEALNYLYKRDVFKMRNDAPPVVILLDLKLPKINGLEVLAHLKADPSLQWIPVVILTSSCEEPDLVRCYELKTNAYVVKPINFQEFMQVVQQLGLFWTVVNQLPPYPSASVG
jgi:CheY-like chemotaxis protein